MDFSFNDEQQMLQDTTRRFLASEYGFEKRASVLQSDAGWSKAVWNGLAELGLLAIELPEEHGGIGADPVAVMLVMQAVGERLLLEPLLSSAIVATRVIRELGSDEQRVRWLPVLADGSTIAVLAHDEPGATIRVENIVTTATPDGHGWRLSGCKSVVYHAAIADLLLVSARIEDGSVGVFAVTPDAVGVSLDALLTIDGQRAADITLDNVGVDASDRLPGDGGQLQAVVDYAVAMFSAEALGSLQRILEATIEYSRSRVQFGAPIGSFQALQHRMADMLMQVEQARSMIYRAIARCTDEDTRERRKAISAAKVIVGQAARHVSQEAIQLHGGMGMTDELDVSHHAKRLLAYELRFGTTDEHHAIYRNTVASHT